MLVHCDQTSESLSRHGQELGKQEATGNVNFSNEGDCAYNTLIGFSFLGSP